MADDGKEAILVSSCLLGLPTRYDGRSKPSHAVLDFLRHNQLQAIPICPEQLAGLPTPRPKTCFTQGDGAALLAGNGELRDELGQVLNRPFLHGARQVLTIAGLCGCRRALFKERSPSCGSRRVYLGNEIISGSGVTSALLRQHGIEVFSEEDLPEF